MEKLSSNRRKIWANRSTPKCIILVCVLYEFKFEINVLHAVQKICQAFVDSCINIFTNSWNWANWEEAMSRWKMHCEHDGHMSLIEELQDAIEEDSTQTCDMLAESFTISDETIRLRLHCLGKVYKLTNEYLINGHIHSSSNAWTFLRAASSPSTRTTSCLCIKLWWKVAVLQQSLTIVSLVVSQWRCATDLSDVPQNLRGHGKFSTL